jgi:hypothetical protein
VEASSSIDFSSFISPIPSIIIRFMSLLSTANLGVVIFEDNFKKYFCDFIFFFHVFFFFF